MEREKMNVEFVAYVKEKKQNLFYVETDLSIIQT